MTIWQACAGQETNPDSRFKPFQMGYEGMPAMCIVCESRIREGIEDTAKKVDYCVECAKTTVPITATSTPK